MNENPSSAPSSAALAAVVPAPAPSTESQLRDLQALAQSLLLSVEAMRATAAHNTAIQDAVGDIRTATKAMLASPAPTRTAAGTPAQKPDCGCDSPDCLPCECVSSKCCTFEVELTHVRVVQMQIEPADTAASTGMEVRLFAAIDNIGAIIPYAHGYLTLHKLINQQGIWAPIYARVGPVSVRKGSTKAVVVTVDALELEDNEPLALRDEYGHGEGTLLLNCCSDAPVSTSFEIHFTGGGQGGGIIEVRITATRKC